MSNKVSSTSRNSKSKDVEGGEGSYCSVKYWSLEFVAEIRPPKKIDGCQVTEVFGCLV